MVSGGSGAGAAGLEAFRELLARAAEDDEARGVALEALCGRAVFAATWSESGDALRTLTNRDGEQAMPLFSGADALQSAAARFSWAKSGALGTRQLSAREAMQSALAQGVAFIVLDVGAEHCVEFARDEVALMLAAKQVRQRPTSGNAAQAAQPSAERDARAGVARGGEHAGRQATSPVRALSSPFNAAPAAANKTAPGHGFEIDAATQRSLGAAPRAQPSGPAVLPSLSPLPFASPNAGDFAASLPLPGAPPPFGALPGAPSLHEPAIDAVTGLGFSYGDPEPEARPAALEAAAMMAEVAKLGDATTQKAAAEVAAMLKQMAVRGMDEGVKPMKNAAKAFAAMLGAELQASEKKPAAGASSAKAEPAVPAAEAEESADGESAEDELPDEPVYEPGALRPLQIGLSDPLQAAIAEVLRSYPEVEWACEVSDGTETPVVGVRISPSFMTRTAEVEKVIMKAAAARRVSLRVLLLTEPGLMREARASGNTFFPWRKRPGRK